MSSFPTSTISATLTPEYDALWHKLHPLPHEMMVSVPGRHVFPLLEYHLTGMNPDKKYTASIHFERVDDKKMRLSTNTRGVYREQISKEKKEAPRKVQHKAGARLGSKWMASRINFDFVKITSRKDREDKDRSIIYLPSQHRFLPVLTITEVGKSSCEIRLPHTQFLTSTVYQIRKVCDIKTNSNKRAKAVRDRRDWIDRELEKSRKKAPAQDTSVSEASDSVASNSIPNSIPNSPAIDHAIPSADLSTQVPTPPVVMNTLSIPSAGVTQTPPSSAIPAAYPVPPADPLNGYSAIEWMNSFLMKNQNLLTSMGFQFPTIPFVPSPTNPPPTSAMSQPTPTEVPVKTQVADKVIKQEVV
ncbi:hypothetical protein B9Z55_009544 [Caenorhabditis nigoni]|uniref:T-box domain-containing protein n=3 Tax=Caenorhabditis nigoni TaxID=1611254 RepID=A0A2G5USJ5_9PELO|nr:hypothetical protein B9Z55_009544 [Caenorhabditis nigoni]